jgi:hypothetical protein
MVVVPDLTDALEHARTEMQKKEERPIKKVTTHYEPGYILTRKGLFILDSDGVGSSDPVKTVEIGIYREFDNSFDMMPHIMTFSPSEFQALPVKETKNLADFIRSFGNRLEENYEDWRSAMEAASAERIKGKVKA